MPVKNLDIVGNYLNSLSSATPFPGGQSAARAMLSVLLDYPEPMAYKDFWKAAHLLGYSGDEFSATLRRLRSTGAVQLGREGENPLVYLTPLGKTVAKVESGERL